MLKKETAAEFVLAVKNQPRGLDLDRLVADQQIELCTVARQTGFAATWGAQCRRTLPADLRRTSTFSVPMRSMLAISASSLTRRLPSVPR
jgi:hypothetical protein